MSSAPTAHGQSSAPKTSLIIGGILSILVAGVAFAAPVVFSQILAKLIGCFCLLSGAIGISAALFGQHSHHRILSGLSALIRIAAGVVLLWHTTAGLVFITLVLACAFLAEGAICIIVSLRMRSSPAWIWILLNGLTALILGIMIYNRWPLDGLWLVGMLYGIQSLFSGTTLLILGLSKN